MIFGIDVSTYLEELANGAKFYDETGEIDPLDAFIENGVSYMRIRLWNDPFSSQGEPYLAGSCDLNHYITLGKLAKSKGFHLFLDLHYSDFWADPNKQITPKAWTEYNLDELTDAVYEFTKECLIKAKDEDVLPELIQVGNEITNGILWPVGKIDRESGSDPDYSNFLRLLKAGIRACREIAPKAKLMLHIERSHDAALYQEFFGKMEEAGVDYDVIGASYYPYWHGTPEELFANLTGCRRFGKEIMIAEMGYGFIDEPYQLDDGKEYYVFDSKRVCVPGFTEKYPMSPEGQVAFLRDFLSEAKATGVDGVFYWEPLWIPGKGICWTSEAGQGYIHEEGKPIANEWANQCLFDYEGRKLPGFDEYKP